jgi:hypothetical protein
MPRSALQETPRNTSKLIERELIVYSLKLGLNRPFAALGGKLSKPLRLLRGAMAAFNLQLRQAMSQRSIDGCHLIRRNVLAQPGSGTLPCFFYLPLNTSFPLQRQCSSRLRRESRVTGGIDFRK